MYFKKLTSIMKKLIVLFIVIMAVSAQAESKKLKARLWHTTFWSPVDGPYVETYLAFDAASLEYKKIGERQYQGSLEITMIFRQNDSIRDYAKYELKSPVVEDTSNIQLEFIDQQRFLLQNGQYEFLLSIADQNSENEPFAYEELIDISYPDDQVNVSGIELVDSYEPVEESHSVLSKSGYKLIPYVSNFYPAGRDNLMFYTEVYNTDKVLGENEKIVLKYFIESFETGKVLSKFQKFKPKQTNLVIPTLSEFDLRNLPSGNYKLGVEVRDRNNELVTSNKLFFQRSNPNMRFDLNDIAAVNITNSFVEDLTSRDTLQEYIQMIRPIATQVEKQFIDNQSKEADLETLQQFFLNFWQTRDEIKPREAWLKYLDEVEKVNKVYSTQIMPGYTTDRGRVYLQYGPPNIITESYNEPSAYPYEIWHYYQLGNSQRDKKFVFYTYNLVTNDFVLLHSNAIGELSNYRWQAELHRRDFDPQSPDDMRPPDAWGNQANEYYINPR